MQEGLHPEDATPINLEWPLYCRREGESNQEKCWRPREFVHPVLEGSKSLHFRKEGAGKDSSSSRVENNYLFIMNIDWYNL